MLLDVQSVYLQCKFFKLRALAALENTRSQLCSRYYVSLR